MTTIFDDYDYPNILILNSTPNPIDPVLRYMYFDNLFKTILIDGKEERVYKLDVYCEIQKKAGIPNNYDYPGILLILSPTPVPTDPVLKYMFIRDLFKIIYVDGKEERVYKLDIYREVQEMLETPF